MAGNIYRAASRIRDLLADLNSVVNGNGSTAEICDIRDVIAMASGSYAGSQSIQVRLDAPDAVKIRLVRSRIERVFVNLFANSVEAMPEGGEIRIGVRKAIGSVLVAVEDTGPGIPNRIRDRLFVPFVTEGKDNGLGLGLALSRQTMSFSIMAEICGLNRPPAPVLSSAFPLNRNERPSRSDLSRNGSRRWPAEFEELLASHLSQHA